MGCAVAGRWHLPFNHIKIKDAAALQGGIDRLLGAVAPQPGGARRCQAVPGQDEALQRLWEQQVPLCSCAGAGCACRCLPVRRFSFQDLLSWDIVSLWSVLPDHPAFSNCPLNLHPLYILISGYIRDQFCGITICRHYIQNWIKKYIFLNQKPKWTFLTFQQLDYLQNCFPTEMFQCKKIHFNFIFL